MPSKPKIDTAAIEAAFLAILKKYERGSLKLELDRPGMWVLKGPPNEQSGGKEVWFAGMRVGKSYMSYYVMAFYGSAELVASLSPELKKRKQGKTCFNFRKFDAKLFRELAALTAAAHRIYKKLKLVT